MRHKYILAICLIFGFLSTSAQAAEEWDKTRPNSIDIKNAWPAAVHANNDSLDRLLGTFQDGMKLTYSTANTIVVGPGSIVCSNAALSIRHLRQNTSSTNVTFSDLDTGAEQAGTTYYVYASCDADATTAAFKISASATTPSGLTYYKRLGSFANDGNSNMTAINNDDTAQEIGPAAAKSIGSTYQALSDGLVCGFLMSGTCTYLIGYTDGNSSPTTAMGAASTAVNGQADHTVTANSFCMPVKSGDYYKVTAAKNDPSCSDGTQTEYFVPLQ